MKELIVKIMLDIKEQVKYLYEEEEEINEGAITEKEYEIMMKKINEVLKELGVIGEIND